MSYEITTRPLPIVNPEPVWEWYYYVPLLDREEWSGIEYDNIQYGWDELDYRFGVQYDSVVPEPSVTSLLMGLAIFGIILYKRLK